MATEYLKIPAIAKRWEVSEYTVRRRLVDGLPHVKIGGSIRVRLDDLERYEAARRRGGALRPARAARRESVAAGAGR